MNGIDGIIKLNNQKEQEWEEAKKGFTGGEYDLEMIRKEADIHDLFVWLTNNVDSENSYNIKVAAKQLIEAGLHYKRLERRKMRTERHASSLVDDEGFLVELQRLINKHSQEKVSNTPDFILADYVTRCLDAFDLGVKARETWFGR